MISKSILGGGCALLFITLSATAGSVPLNVISYNFALAGGGGGASATLNGVPVQIFCDDFANEIYLPSSNTANVTTLGTSADLSETRFGGVSSNGWTTITLTDGNSVDTQDDAFFNSPGSGSSALARYEMVAYLVSPTTLAWAATLSITRFRKPFGPSWTPRRKGRPSIPRA